MPRLMCVAAVLALGCATPYQRKGALGGYEDLKVGPDTYFITVTGTVYTDLQTVQMHLRRRALELCPGGFDMVGEDGGMQHATTVLTKNQLTGGYTATNLNKPAVAGTVRCTGPRHAEVQTSPGGTTEVLYDPPAPHD